MDNAEGIQQNIETPVPAENIGQGVQPEKVLKQSEVNELVGRIKHEAYTKGMRDAQTQYQPTPTSGQSMGGIQQVTEDQIRQMIADEAHKQTQIAEANKLLSNFASQYESGKERYSDYDATVAKLGELKNIPHIVKLAAETGMAGDVMYELGRNPGKVATLTTLAYINPQLASQEMQELASSIKRNQEAAQAPQAEPPLSQVRPSTVGKDNGSNSVRDLRRKPWARA